MRTLRFLAGILVGGAFGALAVLLTAPQSGEETQMMVSEKLDTLKSEAKKAFEERKMNLERKMADLQAG